MTQPLLSILIPTVKGERAREFAILYLGICMKSGAGSLRQIDGEYDKSCNVHFAPITNEIELCYCDTGKEMTIGEKRELLYQKSNGLYSWQIDDDDDIAPNAIQLILEAIKSNPEVDVISFEEYVSIDGKEYKSNHSNSYHDWEGDGNSLLSDGFHFHRTIFFKDVVRTELAKSVPVPRLRWAEDHEWAKLLKPLIQSEVHISQQLYKYIHISSNPQERYGLDK